MLNSIALSKYESKKKIFLAAESLVFCTFLIILSQSFHPSLTKNSMQLQPIMFRLFSNVFFTVVVGAGWAFLSSYSLKNSQENKINHFDNFDILMMILTPILSFLMAESFTISGLLALMTCSFLQSIYGQKNLDPNRQILLQSIFKALSYTSRSICDILIGFGLGLHLHFYQKIGGFQLLMVVALIQIISFMGACLTYMKA